TGEPEALDDRQARDSQPAYSGDHRDPVSRRPLALSLGDPAGIGPEITVKAWAVLRDCGPVFMVVGDYAALAAASGAGRSILQRVSGPEEAAGVFSDAIPVLDIPLQAPVIAAQPSVD